VEIDTLEYSRVKAIVVSMRLRIYLFALTNTNNDDKAEERGLATLNQMYEELRRKCCIEDLER
jgi:hypothetical protein